MLRILRWILTGFLLLNSVHLSAVTVTNLVAPTSAFPAGGIGAFTNDYNQDGISDDRQDMTCRFQFTTPTAFSTNGYLLFEAGNYHVGITLLLMNDRLVLTAGGDSSSTSIKGTHALQVFSKPLAPAHQYQVIFGLRIDDDRDGTNTDSRLALYLDGQYAVDPAFPGTHTISDIRDSGIAHWSGTISGGFGVSSNGSLFIVEGSAPKDFTGPNFTSSNGSLDSSLDYFANTFYDAIPQFRGPNILLITADDMNFTTVGCFGGPQPSVTPNIDRFASEGIKFTRAHVAVGVCQPSREALMTGLYPHNNGGEGFDPIKPQVTSLTEVLDNLDYRLGILAKTSHLQPASEFQWDLKLAESALCEGRNPGSYYTNSKAFMQQAIAMGRPFFLMANSNDPHRPFHRSTEETNSYTQAQRNTFAVPSRVYTPGEISVPGFLPDLPNIRLEMSQYYSSARRCDDTVGRIFDALDELRVATNTIVIFLSDNGISMPFAKSNDYLQSHHTPLVIRWPGVVAPGRTDSKNFIVCVDLMPTILEAIGLSNSLHFDGFSFIPLLRGAEVQSGRDVAATVFHETSAGERYEMRAIRGGRYGYIYNPWSNGSLVCKNETQNGLAWDAMVAAGSSNPAIQNRVNFFKYRVQEEFYDYSQDPDALFNLAQRPELAPFIYTARQNLLAWMLQTGDSMRTNFQTYVAAHPVSYNPLSPPRRLAITKGENPSEVLLQYSTISNMLYQTYSSSNLGSWQTQGSPFNGTGSGMTWAAAINGEGSGFFSVDEYFDLNRY